MSNLVFPVLQGLGYNIHKIPTWSTRTQRANSGRELALFDYANPIWNFKLTYEILRDRQIGGFTSEFRVLIDFFQQVRGAFDTFLFEDKDDKSVVDELLVAVPGSVVDFQLVRRLYAGGFPEDIIAPNIITNVKIGGVTTGAYTLDTTTGIVTFPGAPGGAVTSTFSFYFRCRFMTDTMDFENWSHLRWMLQELKFKSIVL